MSRDTIWLSPLRCVLKMANDGYPYYPASQSSFSVAPPLGHIPPPPPTKPPPYPHLSTFSQSDPLTNYSQYCNTSYEQYDQQTANEQDKDEKADHNSVTSNKTIAEASDVNESTKISTHQTISRDINKDTDNVQMAMPTSEEKYKSDEGLKMKFSGGFLNKKRPNPSIAVQLKPAQANNTKKSKTESGKISVAQAFGSDSDDDDGVEEMPRAAKLRMRNIGKDTPTSAGPNSFNKTTKGFTDTAAAFKKQYGL